MHEEYVGELVADGYLPDRSQGMESEDYNDLPPLVDAAGARVDEGEESEDDLERVDEQVFYVWNDESPQPWDLQVSDIADDFPIKDKADLVDLDTCAMKALVAPLDSATAKCKKKSKLLDEAIGINDLTIGIDCMMLDALQPYKHLVERLQVQTGPIGHLVCGWIIEMFDNINETFLGRTPTFGSHFNRWVSNKQPSPELVAQIKAMGRQFLHAFLTRVRYRLQPYWKLIMGLELVSPCSPARVAPEAWDGVANLMERVGWSQDKIHKGLSELRLQRRRAARWSYPQIVECKRNLLHYFKQRSESYSLSDQYDFSNADSFAQLVFCLHVASAIIETFFSKTKYIKSRSRMSMADKTVADVLTLSQVPAPDDVENFPPSAVSIDVTSASSRSENDLHVLRRKYLDRKVSRTFQVDGDTVQYKGVIDRVFWEHETHRFLFHVSYLDGDEEELELWQIRTFII